VFRPIDLEEIDVATTAVRIGAAVGRQKRAAIQTKAAALGIKILNPKEAKIVAAVPVTEGEVTFDE
jgi:large subunit ribosomal protein L32e